MHVTSEKIEGWLFRVCRPIKANGKWIYDYTVTVDLSEDPNWAIIKGFYHPETSGDDWDLIIKKINKVTGRLVKGERQHRPEVWIVQKDPKLTEGKIIMTVKKRIPHVDEAAGDPAKHLAAIDLLKQQVADGHYRVELKQESIAPGHERIIADRFETNPAAPTAE